METQYVPIAVSKLEDPTGIIWIEKKEGETDNDAFNRYNPLPTNINKIQTAVNEKIDEEKVNKKTKKKSKKITNQRLELEKAFRSSKEVNEPVSMGTSLDNPILETKSINKVEEYKKIKEVHGRPKDEAVEKKILKHLTNIAPRTACKLSLIHI